MSEPSKEALLESFVPGASIPIRETMLKIYGYGVTDPDFVEAALSRLEELGCSTVREEYANAVNEWKRAHNAMLRRVSAWYVKDCRAMDKKIIEKEGDEVSQKIKNLTRQELMKLYNELSQNGTVKDPEEFAEMMIQYQQA